MAGDAFVPAGEEPKEISEVVEDATETQMEPPRQREEEEEEDEEETIGEFVLWAAQRWHLLRELLMDEDLNNAALGGNSVSKFQVGGLARRCISSRDWVRSVNLLGFSGNAFTVFKAIAQECGSEEQENQLRAAGVDHSNIITLIQLRRFEAQKSSEGRVLTVLDEGSPSWRFAQLLRRKRRNLLRAWRLDLDVDDNGTVTFVEFSHQCRQLGFQGCVRQIWTSLRPLDDRALEFAELAPVEAEHLEKFAELIWNVSGYDLDKAWSLFDYEKKNKLTRADFIESAEHLGFTGNADMLFKGLDREGLGWVWRADFDYIPKVSRSARERLRETEGPLASLVSFANYQIGGCEELITKLGLGGGTSEVNVCDLAARLTALGFDGDAQHAAVLAARCDRGIGTQISAQKLLKVLSSAKSPRAKKDDQGGTGAALGGMSFSPTCFIRKKSSAVAKPKAKSKRAAKAAKPPPWDNTVNSSSCNSSKLHPHLRFYFNDFDREHRERKQATVRAMKEDAKTSSRFWPMPRRSSQSSQSSRRSQSQVQPTWHSGHQVESADTPRALRRYFGEDEVRKPVRDELHTILRSRETANSMTPSQGMSPASSPAASRARSVGF